MGHRKEGIGMKIKTNPSSRTFLLLFTLLASSMLTSPEYVDCQRFLPDEASDVLGVTKVSQKGCLSSCLSILTAFPSARNHPWLFFQSKAFTSQSIHSKTGLAAFMRC